MSRKNKIAMGLLVCWKCQDQNNKRPLIKIDGTNYGHKDCVELYGKPGASNQSLLPFRPQEVAEKIGVTVPVNI